MLSETQWDKIMFVLKSMGKYRFQKEQDKLFVSEFY